MNIHSGIYFVIAKAKNNSNKKIQPKCISQGLFRADCYENKHNKGFIIEICLYTIMEAGYAVRVRLLFLCQILELKCTG